MVSSRGDGLSFEGQHDVNLLPYIFDISNNAIAVGVGDSGGLAGRRCTKK